MTRLEEAIEKARRLNIDELLILDKVIQEAKILHNTLWPKRIDLGKSFDKLKDLTFDDMDKLEDNLDQDDINDYLDTLDYPSLS